MDFDFSNPLSGRVEETDGTYIATQFHHLFGLPLAPIRSYLIEENIHEAVGLFLPLGIQRHSVVRALLRTWGLPLVVAFTLAACVALRVGRSSALSGGLVGATLLSAGLWVWATYWLGRLDPEECARRATYGRVVGWRFDVARVAPFDSRVVARLERELAARLERAIADGYDPGARRAEGPLAIADDPAMCDVDYLEAALTSARWRWSIERPGPARAALEQAHARIWARYKTVAARRVEIDTVAAEREPSEKVRIALVLVALAGTLALAWVPIAVARTPG